MSTSTSQTSSTGIDNVIDLAHLLEAANGYAHSRDGHWITVPDPSSITGQVFLPILENKLGIPVTFTMVETVLEKAGYTPVRKDQRATTWQRPD